MSHEVRRPVEQIFKADPALSGISDLLAMLRRALEKDELQLYRQPMRSPGGQAEGLQLAEVLVRLREEEDA